MAMLMGQLQLQERFQGLIKGQALAEEPLASHTYFRIGGPAEVMAFPADLEDLKVLLKAARDEAIPVLILGGGSNMLVSDEGVRGSSSISPAPSLGWRSPANRSGAGPAYGPAACWLSPQ
ncbi:MAG: hypothetical protein M5R38_11280 [Candidatus Methylomirabilis sp.]|nr:hypothetical protein [Candidatus Methylomirabilis sp.]